MQLSEDRIDWIANAHCPSGTAHPSQVKNAIREALAEALRAQADARPVLWWNGIRKGEAGDFVGPSFSEKEDTNHDIPLVSAVNPCNIAPVDMMLHCPNCGLQHIDHAEPAVEHEHGAVEFEAWDNPPHRSHLCHGCGHIWRPADVPTNGVLAVKTKGQNDSPITGPDRVDDTHPEASAPGLSEPAFWISKSDADWLERVPNVNGQIQALRLGGASRVPVFLTRVSAATQFHNGDNMAVTEDGRYVGASAATVAEPSGGTPDTYPARLLHESDASLAERVDSWHKRHPQAAQQQAEPGADEMAAFESWAYRKILHSASEAWQVWQAAWRAAQSGQRAGVVTKPWDAAAHDVLAERTRQITHEGATPIQDDGYTEGELALAAACYAMSSSGYAKGQTPPIWPWNVRWWKPSYGRRDLVKAGALILAEIERLDRAAAPTQQQEGGE